MITRIVEGVHGAREATGVVVIIDVMRAFTTAAYPGGLQGIPYAPESVVATVRNSRAAVIHRTGDADFPSEDVDCAVAIDAFEFAMKAERSGSGWIAKRFYVGA